MGQMRPSEEVIEQARRVLKVARDRGVDPVLALDDAALLMTPALRAAMIAAAITRIADLIDEASIRQLQPAGLRTPATPADVKRMIVLWLRDQIPDART